MSHAIMKRRALTVGMAAALAAAGLVTTQVGSASAAASLTATASPSLGTAAAGTVVAVTGSGFLDSAGAATIGSPKVVLGSVTAAGVCTGTGVTWSSPVYTIISATRIVVTLPAMTLAAGTSSIKAAICFPINGGSTYVTTPYTAALQPVINATPAVALAPASGPTSGGQTFRVATTATTAWQPGASITVGGAPATGVVYSTDKLTLTAVAPASTAGAQAVVVHTPGFADVAAGNYTYQRAIKIAPAFGLTSSSVATPIVITGVGFKSSTYTGSNSFNVYLDNGDSAATPAACGSAQVVSDTEATCVVPASTTAAAYKVTLGDAATYAGSSSGSRNVLSSGSVFTLAGF